MTITNHQPSDQLWGLFICSKDAMYKIKTITDTKLPFDYQHNVCDSDKYFLNYEYDGNINKKNPKKD